jgi:hypothetical protein
MSNINGRKYGFTGLFPIKTGNNTAQLRRYLRSLDGPNYERGSPLANVDLIHMARLVIVDHLPFQGVPAKYDVLSVNFLLFACDFDGSAPEELVLAMSRSIPKVVNRIWGHCSDYPGCSQEARERLVGYFDRYQLTTSLFFADQPEARVPEILAALRLKDQFLQFVCAHQGEDPAKLRQQFDRMWRQANSIETSAN